MATSENPPVFELTILGWRYAFAALSRMPQVLGIAMIAAFVMSLATLPLLPGPKDEPSLAMQLVEFLFGIVQGFFLTPVAIAVHRFVLLGEVTQRYALTPSEPRFKRFFIWTIVFQLLLSGPNLLISFVNKAGYGTALLGGIFFLLVVAVVASLRMLILFPAIAVDASGANWQNAVADTKGHTWRVFFIVLLTSIPSIAVTLLLYFLWIRPDGPNLIQGVVLALVNSPLGVLSLAAMAAVASRLFAAFGNRLNIAFSRPQRG